MRINLIQISIWQHVNKQQSQSSESILNFCREISKHLKFTISIKYSHFRLKISIKFKFYKFFVLTVKSQPLIAFSNSQWKSSEEKNRMMLFFLKKSTLYSFIQININSIVFNIWVLPLISDWSLGVQCYFYKGQWLTDIHDGKFLKIYLDVNLVPQPLILYFTCDKFTQLVIRYEFRCPQHTA